MTGGSHQLELSELDTRRSTEDIEREYVRVQQNV